MTRHQKSRRPALESLEDRLALTVATFDQDTGRLTVLGDDFDNKISVYNVGKNIFVYEEGRGFVHIRGGTPTTDDVSHVVMDGAGGNDSLSVRLSDYSGSAWLDGGEGGLPQEKWSRS